MSFIYSHHYPGDLEATITATARSFRKRKFPQVCATLTTLNTFPLAVDFKETHHSPVSVLLLLRLLAVAADTTNDLLKSTPTWVKLKINPKPAVWAKLCVQIKTTWWNETKISICSLLSSLNCKHCIKLFSDNYLYTKSPGTEQSIFYFW